MENETINELVDELTCTLPALHKKMWAVNYNLLLATDINKSHVGLMFTLYRAENMTLTMSALGNAMAVSKPNVTTIVDKLVALNFVERVNDPDDRRLVYIKLTKEGKAFIEQWRVNLKNAFKKILLNYSDNEVKLLRGTMKNLKILVSRFDGI
jgi:DNA-binding MarR family transcriptional regulator